MHRKELFPHNRMYSTHGCVTGSKVTLTVTTAVSTVSGFSSQFCTEFAYTEKNAFYSHLWSDHKGSTSACLFQAWTGLYNSVHSLNNYLSHILYPYKLRGYAALNKDLYCLSLILWINSQIFPNRKWKKPLKDFV